MTIRHQLLLLHRYTGIALAAFVVLAGLTGSLLAFHHEVDAFLTPELHRVAPGEGRASLDDVGARIEAERPELVVGYFVHSAAGPGPIKAVMNTREAARAGKLDREAAGNSEAYVDPHTGRVLGWRNWGEFGATRAHVVPLVYRLHMSLFLGGAGQWITAIIGVFLLVTLVMGTVLALPRLALLQRAFTVEWRGSAARKLFDLHRAGGLAAGWILAILAFTGVYMNLPTVVEPVLAAVAPFTPRPASVRDPQGKREDVWRIGWDAALAKAREVEPAHPLAVIGRVEARGYYQVRFMPPDDIMDAGTRRVFVDGRDGSILGRFNDREGTAGDLVRIWQFPLHSGQGFGLPGRIAVCIAGLLPLLLAGSGTWLWLRRRARRRESLHPSRGAA